MATISNTPRPGYVWDATDNVWYPIGTGPHSHADYITSGSAINPNIVDAKGDIIAATAADTVARLAVGSNNQVLTADSSTATGLKWATPAAGGKVLQVVEGTLTGPINSSSATYADTGLTVSITPSATSSKVLVFATLNGCEKRTTDTSLGVKLLRGATQISKSSSGYTGSVVRNNHGAVTLMTLDSPSTTSSTTYKVQYASEGGGNIVGINNDGTGANDTVSSIVCLEIGA